MKIGLRNKLYLTKTYKNNRAIVAKPDGLGTFARSPNFLIWLIEKKR
jgi:hypothetical protein